MHTVHAIAETAAKLAERAAKTLRKAHDLREESIKTHHDVAAAEETLHRLKLKASMKKSRPKK